MAERLFSPGGLEVWYQPILDGQTGRIASLEALARLRTMDGTVLYPDRFLPELTPEDLRILSHRVLRQSLTDLAILETQGVILDISVNMIPDAFCPDCLECLNNLLGTSPIMPERITLEILESADFTVLEAAMPVLERIRAMGLHLALDDIGQAYGSLARLKDLPVDKIKLDQKFVRTMGDQPQIMHFVRAMRDLADGLGVALVVEGVETEAILDAVSCLGVRWLQGYAIAKPMPLQQLQNWLHQPTIPRPNREPASLLGIYATQLSEYTHLRDLVQSHPNWRTRLANCDDPRLSRWLSQHGASQAESLLQAYQGYQQAWRNLCTAADLVPGQWDVMDLAKTGWLAALSQAWMVSRG